MKKTVLFACLAIPSFSMAQVSGTILDSLSKEKISGAILQVENSFIIVSSDADGKFFIPEMHQEKIKLKISHIAYQQNEKELILPANNVEVFLSPKTYIAEEVTVSATRASHESPTAFTNVSKEELGGKNLGQDVPFLINATPSVVVTSDAGAGIGYTGIRIRGSDATRVNVTINGIPINDAESHSMYWVDLPDFISSTESMQIQRGIGTSTNGAGAFGGSINIQSSAVSSEPFGEINSSGGSFNTLKNTMKFGTGIMKNKIAFEGRLSKITSDGFVDRGSSDLKSFYLSGGYYGNNSSLRAIVFSGKEKTYQAWNGVPESKLFGNIDSLTAHFYNNYGYYYYFTPADSANLFSSDPRTYNNFTYKGQTDNYQQDYYQLHYSHAFAHSLNITAALHYTKGKGYYEEYKNNQSFADYNLNYPVIGSDTVFTTDLIRQKWLDNDFYGFTFSINKESSTLDWTIGGAGNRYIGRHFDQIIWAQYASNSTIDYIYNDNDASKNDFNIFAKANWSITNQLHLFGDVQYRTVCYSFLGFNPELNNVQQDVSLSFFNPKAGFLIDVDSRSKVYVSLAIGHKEPVRDDYVNSSSATRPKPEEMQDAEAGYKYSGSELKAGCNFYYMNYLDQLILTGQINDVGEYTRQNVPNSHRAGVEIEASWNILKNLMLNGNVTLSENKIDKFNQYVDDYDAGNQQVNTFKNTDIAFSPSVISSFGFSWLPVKNLSLDLVSKYVAKQFLDNTSSDKKKLDSYLTHDFLINCKLPVSFAKEFSIRLGIYNFLDEEYESNGYTYEYISYGRLIRENFYYPQAGINFLGGISVKF